MDIISTVSVDSMPPVGPFVEFGRREAVPASGKRCMDGSSKLLILFRIIFDKHVFIGKMV